MQCATLPCKERIFLFVFGGRDANYEDDELAYRNVFLAISTTFGWQKQGGFLKWGDA